MLDYLHLSANKFAGVLGYSRAQTIYDIVNGKCMPSYDFFKRFVNSEVSDKINLEWLIAGKGVMEKNDKQSNSSTIHTTDAGILSLLKELAGENALLKRDLEECRSKKNAPMSQCYGNRVAEP